eukprot:1050440-Rhodomonas_salina.2
MHRTVRRMWIGQYRGCIYRIIQRTLVPSSSAQSSPHSTDTLRYLRCTSRCRCSPQFTPVVPSGHDGADGEVLACSVAVEDDEEDEAEDGGGEEEEEDVGAKVVVDVVRATEVDAAAADDDDDDDDDDVLAGSSVVDEEDDEDAANNEDEEDEGEEDEDVG